MKYRTITFTLIDFFISPNLMVHLQKLGFRATGTIRDDRVFTKDMFTTSEKKRNSKRNDERKRLIEKHKLSKKNKRGSFVVT